MLLEVLGAEVSERLDGDLLPALYAAVTVPTAVIRAELRDEGLAYTDGLAGLWPPLPELDAAAQHVIAQARRQGTGLGVVSGFVGAVAVPPEVLASLVLAVRLGQRLAVIYGHDPETDAGRLVLWRAVTSAYGIELPGQAQVGVRMRDLPELVRSQLPATQQAATWMVRQVAARTVMAAVGRVTRLIPGLGAGIGGYSGNRRVRAMGARMAAVLRRAAEAQPFELGDEALAVEV